jgi:hypothetical protein
MNTINLAKEADPIHPLPVRTAADVEREKNARGRVEDQLEAIRALSREVALQIGGRRANKW